MIGKQINFYATEIDQARILREIDASPGCVLLSRDDESEFRVSPGNRISNSDWAVSYLCPIEAVEPVLASLSRLSIASELLAIEFIRPGIENHCIQRGRFWYSPTYFEGGEPVEKPTYFREWAQAVFRAARRGMRKFRGADLMGPNALELIEEGVLTIQQ
jgi:hypothetical protein